jgi:hypothetical protein
VRSLFYWESLSPQFWYEVARVWCLFSCPCALWGIFVFALLAIDQKYMRGKMRRCVLWVCIFFRSVFPLPSPFFPPLPPSHKKKIFTRTRNRRNNHPSMCSRTSSHHVLARTLFPCLWDYLLWAPSTVSRSLALRNCWIRSTSAC